jgi:hypothetical protein
LIRIIQFMFGKPDPERKFYYWMGVIFYFIAMVTFIIQIAISGSITFLPVLLFPALVFPILFRIVYLLNTKLYYKFKGKTKRIFLIATAFTIGFILIVTAALSFFSKDANIVFNSRRTDINGEIHLTVGSLKGYYDVEQFTVTKPEKISIPYDASAQLGEIALLVIDSNQTIVWAENITQSGKGIIEYNAKAGDYIIKVSTKEAKKIEIKLSLK